MAKKINYSKVEKEVEEALIRMQIEQLQKGIPTQSSRAIEYYGLDEPPRPIQEDPVETLLSEEASKGSSEVIQDEEIAEINPEHDTLLAAKERKVIPRKPQNLTEGPKIESKEQYELPPDDLLILRRHIFWMKQHGIEDRYERLGTTLAEISMFRKKQRLADEDKVRIQTLAKKAHQLKEEITKTLGLASDEALIEKEKKRHKTKRFNVREKWLPL